MLQTKIENLLMMHKSLKEKYSKMMLLQPTNMTVKEFVNDIRLKRAEQILSKKKINISEE